MADLLHHLVDRHLLTAQQAAVVQRRHQRTGVAVEQAVLDLQYCTADAAYRALAECSGMPFCELGALPVPREAGKLLPSRLSTQFHCVPISVENGILRLAFSQLPEESAINQLRLLGVNFEPVLATPEAVESRRRAIYGVGVEDALRIRQQRIERFGLQTPAKAIVEDDAESGQPSVARLVNDLVDEAIDQRATDIHIEPFENQLRIRLRIDGMLRQIPTPPELSDLSDAIAARIKVMAQLNIAERRIPQDGRLQFNHRGRVLNLRLSVLPSRHGETLCLRILSADSLNLELSHLGLNDTHLALLQELTARASGMMLVTGPTGSGKTTTLYSVLTHLKDSRPELKIITVEDPVEYDITGLTQIQTHAEIGLTFSAILRSILRHDPDIILVGEIRDRETAEIAIQSAMTGHLVFSTLHTNDSIGAVNRLINMGAEPDLVASSLNCVIAQRLVRRLCPECAQPMALEELPAATLSAIRQAASRSKLPSLRLMRHHPGGCAHCGHTGYSGRVAIYEFFEVTGEIEDLIAGRPSDGVLRSAARKAGMQTFREDGWLKAAQGLTDIDEVLRVTAGKHC